MIQEAKTPQEIESIYRQYVDIVNETNIVSKSDLNGNITYVNKKFIEISGYSEEELLGKPHNIIRDPDVPSSLFRELWSTIQSKKIWRGIVSNRRKDGSKYIVDASIFPIIDVDGKIVEYISIRHDITELKRLSQNIEEMHAYNIEQEHMAREKLEAGIINDLDEEGCLTLRYPTDVLSGDIHSIYKREDGSIFVYLMDGQGHGISPALTVFAISSILNQFIYHITTLDELVTKLYPTAKTFLGEIEQLSYTMIMISSDKRAISYVSGGMYPFLIKNRDEVIRVKANNLPFMNFSSLPIISEIVLDSWDSLMIYSDGIIEHEIENIDHHMPEELIKNPLLIKDMLEQTKLYKFEDDITIIYLENC